MLPPVVKFVVVEVVEFPFKITVTVEAILIVTKPVVVLRIVIYCPRVEPGTVIVEAPLTLRIYLIFKAVAPVVPIV